MKINIIGFVLVGLLGIGALVFGIGALQEGARSPAAVSLSGALPIGGIMILSGEGAAWGEASRNGMELAIRDINASGGVNGRLLRGVYEDDGSDPAQAVSAFNKLTETDGVSFVIGPNWSNTGLAVAPLADEKGVVMISPSLGVAEFNESSPYIFNTWQHDDILSAKLADIVFERGHRTIALFGANDVWVKVQTEAFTKRFTELGGTIAHIYEPVAGTTDARTEIQKVLKNPAVDAVVMTTDGLELTAVTARQFRELGSALPFYNITVDSKMLAECGRACDGMLFPTSLTPTKAFSEYYHETYGRDVEIGADSAYDAVMLIAEAMKETGSFDPERVAKYLASVHTYEGVSGTLIADGKRGFTKDYVLIESRDGKPIPVP